MADEALWLLGGIGFVGCIVLTMRRCFPGADAAATHAGGPPDEPCWTEEVAHDGRYSYGRGQCHNAELSEIEARIRMGELGPRD
jgi:hypothetical protein